MYNVHIEYVKQLIVDKQRETIGAFIRRIRNEKGLSLADIAHRSGGEIDASYINRIENGYVNNPTPKKLIALAKGLGISEDETFAVARGVPPKDSAEYKESQFASMAFKYHNMPKSSKRRATVEELIKLLDRELDAAQGE